MDTTYAPAAGRRSAFVTTESAAALTAAALVFAASTQWYAVFKAMHVAFAVIWGGGAHCARVGVRG